MHPIKPRIAAVLRRIKKWDSEQELDAHPWWKPRGLFFWWLWRPFLFAVVVVIFFVPTLLLCEAADRLFGTDREYWMFAIAFWVVFWLYGRLGMLE